MPIYNVKTDIFEGPLDLLQNLIEKRKLHINTLSLREITSDYMKYVKDVDVVKVEDIAEFVYIASILVLIKSKSLLPMLDYTKETEQDIEILENRVKLFDYIVKNVSVVLDKWKRISYPIKAYKRKKEVSFSPDKSCTKTNIEEKVMECINDMSYIKKPKEKVVSNIISIEEMMDSIINIIKEKKVLNFSDMENKDKKEVIISFLAILELIKNEFIDVDQSSKFSQISLMNKEV